MAESVEWIDFWSGVALPETAIAMLCNCLLGALP